MVTATAGCSGSQQDLEHSAQARQIARAAQALTESAHLGLLGITGTTYRERAPNPNPYVGQLLFERYCEVCHGSSGKAPEIRKNRASSKDAESDFYIIQYGVGDMPGFRTRLTKFQVYDVLCNMGDDLSPLIEPEQ